MVAVWVVAGERAVLAGDSAADAGWGSYRCWVVAASVVDEELVADPQSVLADEWGGARAVTVELAQAQETVHFSQ